MELLDFSRQKVLRQNIRLVALFFPRQNVLFGFGVVNLMFGGIILCSKVRTALIKLLIPEAPSAWPMFGFTYCRSAGTIKEVYSQSH